MPRDQESTLWYCGYFSTRVGIPGLTPKFSVVNGSDKPVQVVAYWRNESKGLGTLSPSQKVEFVVNAEAAMSFKAKFANGKELASDEIYFTSGTSVEANISESAIKLEYVPST